MKSVYKYLSALLLVSYIVLCHFRQPQISDSIIILCLAGLAGFRMYLDKMETPDIRKELAQALANRDEVLRTLENKINSISFQTKAPTDMKNIRF